jgi:RimJ/RimL family protein N-acetyltransferase
LTSDDPWNPPIATERLSLSPLVPADAEELVNILGDESLYQFTGGTPASLEELRSRLDRWVTRSSPDRKERWLNWLIRDRKSGGALGTLQATVRASDTVAEVAWVLGVTAQGHGYAKEGGRALIAFLESRGVKEIIAHIHPDHRASAGVAAAVGMRPTDQWADDERVWRLTTEPH